jgi:hypothetical protein
MTPQLARAAVALAARLERLTSLGPRVAARVLRHRAGQAVSRVAFRGRLALGRSGTRFGEVPVTVSFGPCSDRLARALARVAELVYAGAVPLSSDVWLDLNANALFCPVWSATEPDGGPGRGVLRSSPIAGLEESLPASPFRNDRKIPQDLARLTTLWYLVAADSGATDQAVRRRQARFRDHLRTFFARATSARHAFWSCPMDAGIGATTLLVSSGHFIRLDPGSPEAADLRAIADRWCSRALAFVTTFDERTPTLNNNHHLLNRISSALLAGLSSDRGAFDTEARRLEEELGHHFDADGLLTEGSTWYHAFVHDALRFAVDLLGAAHPGHRFLSALRARVDALANATAIFAVGGRLLLIGDADGAVYGPNIALQCLPSPSGAERIAIVRRPGAPGDHRWARREGNVVVVSGRATEIEDTSDPPPAEAVATSVRRRGRLLLVATRLPAHPRCADGTLRVRHLPGFGAVVMDHGTRKIVVRTVPQAPPSALGHFHLDVGSIYVALDGRWLIPDPGVVTYTGDLALRDRLRRSALHSTIIPDERQPIQPTGPFSAARVPLGERVVSHGRGVRVEHAAGDDAYHLSARLARGRITVRQWTLSPRRNVPQQASSPSSYGYRT